MVEYCVTCLAPPGCWLDIILPGGSLGMRLHWHFLLQQYLNPEILVEGAWDHAPLKEEKNPLLIPLTDFKVKVLPPVAQLCSLQGLHMEVRTLNLRREMEERGRDGTRRDERGWGS